MSGQLKLAMTLGMTVLFGLAACQQQAPEQAGKQVTASAPGQASPAGAAAASASVELGSGIDSSAFDPSVRPQDDIYNYVNGKWIAETTLPADKSIWGAFYQLHEDSQDAVRALVEEISATANAAPGSPTQKIRDYYNSYMDSERPNALGVEAIQAELDQIKAIDSYDELFRLFSTLGVYGVNNPLGMGIDSDLTDPNVIVVFLAQAGITLPDRDYYLKDDEQFARGRQLYRDYVTRLFELAGVDGGADKADALYELEHALAEVQWSREDRRDPVKANNPHSLEQLATLAPNISWEVALDAAQVGARDRYIVQQPSFFAAASDIIAETPLETWQDYLSFQTMDAFAPVLGDEFFQAWFEFYRAGLQGIEQPEPKWRRAVTSMNSSMGELLGQLYVERHYRQESRVRMEAMIANLVEAYRQSIMTLDWMSEETRQQALLKLSKFTPKIGYPEKWRDYGNMEIVAGDPVANLKSATTFEYLRNVDKLDRPVDKSEWFLTPQTVNAYYNPQWNEIVFPAAILQPPFFNVEADDAVNYGSIGAVIGHEIGHGFDDQGRKFDGDGNLRDWWTEEDSARFLERKNKLAAQYNGYEVIDGLTINGEFTSGENIGDLGGVGIAYKAYRLSLDGEEAPMIDGLSGAQRFFLGYAQVWRAKARDAEVKRRLTIDPHSPPKFRVNGVAVNVDAFYDAFDVKEGDGMFLPPEDRVRIW